MLIAIRSVRDEFSSSSSSGSNEGIRIEKCSPFSAA